MPLTIPGLAAVMKASNYLMTTINGQDCIKELGYAIGDYIVANALVTYSWNGVNPGPPIAETVPTTGKIISHGINLTWSYAPVPLTGLTWLALEITNGMKIGLYNITAGGWATTPLPWVIGTATARSTVATAHSGSRTTIPSDRPSPVKCPSRERLGWLLSWRQAGR